LRQTVLVFGEEMEHLGNQSADWA